MVNVVTDGNEFGMFRAYFEFRGVTGTVEEFVTFNHSEGSEYDSVESHAESVVQEVATETYDAPVDSVELTDVEYLSNYENRQVQ